MNKKITGVGIVLMMVIVSTFAGCIEEKEIITTVSLSKGESKTVLELEITLIDVDSSFWYTDNIVTLLVKHIPSNTNTTLILERTDDVRFKQSFKGYTLEFRGTNHEGNIEINIY